MNKELFVYDELNHRGFYKGQLIPSVTQLVDILYPISVDIPKARLENAATKGTNIHNKCFEVNKCFDNPYPYLDNIKRAILRAKELGGGEILDYVMFLASYGLKPYDYEELVFLLDKDNEPICYGHFDLVVMATKDIEINGELLFKEGLLYLIDIKTTSEFDRIKTGLQCSGYKVAYTQCSKNPIEKVYGLHIREGITLKKLTSREDNTTLLVYQGARKIWGERQ